MDANTVDPYFVSLVAASLYNVGGREEEALEFATLVVDNQ